MGRTRYGPKHPTPGGWRIDGLFSPRMMDKVATFRPGLLVIEIRTNYIDASCVTVDELAKTVFRFTKLCLSDYAVCKLIFCLVLPRGPGRFQARSVCFESNRVALIESLAALCPSDSRVSTLTHQRFLNVAELLRDGVHLSDQGLKRYYFSLRRGIVAGLRELQG